jgi:hypothetical protein
MDRRGLATSLLVMCMLVGVAVPSASARDRAPGSNAVDVSGEATAASRADDPCEDQEVVAPPVPDSGEEPPAPPAPLPDQEVVAPPVPDSGEEPPAPPAPLPDQEVVAPPCQHAYSMRGGAAALKVNATVCDIGAPFTVTGSGITMHFTPNSADPFGGGTYDYSGDFKKFTVSGNGTYKLKLGGKGGTLDAKGKGTATGPLGTFSNGGKEHYDLTATTCP